MSWWSALVGQGFMPHGHCYLWRPELVLLHAGSDLMVFLSYMAIPIALVAIAQRRRDIPYRGIWLAFVLFILSCGITHLMEFITLWNPYYWVSGGSKLLTAGVSVVTVGLLVRAIPDIVALPSQADLRASEARFRAAADRPGHGFVVLELRGDTPTVAWANETARRLLDEDSGSLPIAIAIQANACARTGQASDEEIQAGDRWLDCGFTPVDGGVTISLRDVTARRRSHLNDARLASIVASTGDAVISLDNDGHITSWNQAATHLFGYAADDAIGQHVQIILPDDQRPDPSLTQPIAYEGHRRTSAGDLIPVSVRMSPLFDEDGNRVGASKILQDLRGTQRERALQASLEGTQALLREIHHRVKNNLQMVSSLLRLASRQVHDSEAKKVFAESQQRLRSIALVHERLYRGEEFRDVDVAVYLRELAEHLIRGIGHRGLKVTVSGSARCELDTAVPLGLCVNEALTNAVKHAHAHGAGTIDVVVEQEDGHLRVAVGDEGGPMPEDFLSGTRDSLGSSLMRALAGQIGASVSVREREHGKAIVFDVPPKQDTGSRA